MRNWNDIQRQGLAIHDSFERVVSARRGWRAIARSLGFRKRAIHMLARAKRNGYVFVDIDYGFNGHVDFVHVRHM